MDSKILFPDSKILVTKSFDIHQDWESPIPGFFIIEIRRDVKSISEFTDQEALEFIRLVRTVTKGMKDALNIKEIYLFQNEDSEHHFHLWIFPRHDWMDKFGRKIQSVRPIINYAKKNMVNDSVLKEVKKQVKTMKTYLSKTYNL
ncbi:hypothetical protein HYX12_04235 [Candidatus Woesearchaeota archaeon]|nr:hypothetical protein [Candidatus Woesearchaeota archaeon]